MKLTPSIKAFLILIGVVVFIVIYSQHTKSECVKRISYANVGLNAGINKDSLYRLVSDAELASIKAEWSRPMISDSYNIVDKFQYQKNRELIILEQVTNGDSHFGAIILPYQYDEQKKYPVFLWANGLEQTRPSVNLRNKTIKNIIAKLNNHIIVIPSYRGQSLVISSRSYCSDGFFGDAFDGATDDALRLLNYTKQEYKSADEDRVSVCGVSRGGTVALLMAARDSTITRAVSIAGPTNFYTKEAYRRYGKQYKYQFLSTTEDIGKIRKKMIKSSPIYFIDQFPNHLLLIHGRHDKVVNVSHANEVIGRLNGYDNFEFRLTEGGHSFYNWDVVFEWIAQRS